jgi:hypothetical protein
MDGGPPSISREFCSKYLLATAFYTTVLFKNKLEFCIAGIATKERATTAVSRGTSTT